MCVSIFIAVVFFLIEILQKQITQSRCHDNLQFYISLAEIDVLKWLRAVVPLAAAMKLSLTGLNQYMLRVIVTVKMIVASQKLRQRTGKLY